MGSLFAGVVRLIGGLALVLGLAGTLPLGGCAQVKVADPAAARAEIVRMRDQTLEQLYLQQRGSREIVEQGVGHAVFNTTGTSVLFVSGGGGYGVVTDRSGRTTFMQMRRAGAGLGVGAKSERLVFVFRDYFALNRFIWQGVLWGAEGDAAAQIGAAGAAGGGSTAFSGGRVTTFQITDSGVLLNAMVTGTRFQRDENLNP
jgi:lipid-binding SYLF domain-containing protein